jgi:purine-binding chemotaxis protein CheW
MTLSTPEASTVRPDPSLQSSLAGKYLSFFLSDEEYGIEILKVQEIIGVLPVTAIPRTPPHVLGVINLRGKIIPVVDLRMRFDLESVETTEETCVIVVATNGVVMGLQVDRVSEVIDVTAEQIEATPNFGAQINTDYILGLGNCDGRVRLLLDIDRVLPDPTILNHEDQ